jgi:hypothetical protein
MRQSQVEIKVLTASNCRVGGKHSYDGEKEENIKQKTGLLSSSPKCIPDKRLFLT